MELRKVADVALIAGLIAMVTTTTWATYVYLEANEEHRSYMRMAAAGGVAVVIGLALAGVILLRLRRVPSGRRPATGLSS